MMVPHLPAQTPRSLIERLKTDATYLGPAERKVIVAVIEAFEQIPDLSATDLAARAQTSAATVVRAAQNLGYSGFQRLKDEISRSLLAQADQSQVATAQGQVSGAVQLSALQLLSRDVFAAAQSEIALTERMLASEVMEQAVTAVASAKTILLVGTGGSAIPAQEAALRYTMSGLTAVAPVDVLGQQFTARMLSERDVCIAVSYSGANKHTLDSVRAAQTAGALIIAITSSGISPLAQQADLTLTAGSRNDDQEVLVSRISHTLVLNILGLAAQRLVFHDAEPHMGPSEKLGPLLSDALEPDISEVED
ncbi:hypothetical protein DCC24_04955 [Auritidibacter sp. NML100628]|nr:hypothetical protein DCC24_04955 [Auritidibacter sp. NML100628]